MNRRKCFTVFYRFSKQCRPFSQNGTERNDKNYCFRSVLRNGIRNFFLTPTVYVFIRPICSGTVLVRVTMINNEISISKLVMKLFLAETINAV